MLKKTKICLFLITILLILSSCQTNNIEKSYYTFVDDLNVEVKLNDAPKRVAVLFSSFVEIWQVSGGSVDITVKESIDRGFVSDDVMLVDGGAGKTINIESLISFKPDFVICSSDIPAQVEVSKLLNSVGIPAACFKVEDFTDYLKMLKVCTDINNNSEAYGEYGLKVKEEINQILLNVNYDSTKILFIRASSTSKSTKAKNSKDHFVAKMLEELGTKNIADEAKVLLDGLSIEEIIIQDPDYIFISTMGNEESAINYMESLFNSDIWQSLSAVKNKKYYYLPKDLFQFKPNMRWAEAYNYLLEVLNEK